MTTRGVVSVIGVGCRIPGASGVEGFWKLLMDGRVSVTEWPEVRRGYSRIWARALDDKGALPRIGRFMVGGYLSDIDRFDPTLFGITAREAAAMDPQHRILLETAWEALQDAGIDPRSVAGSGTGVYVGVSSNDYGLLSHELGEKTGPYLALGSSKSLAANRLSHSFGLQGPSFALDAACASSLVAVHLACQALLSGEIDTALAGGVNLILAPGVNASFARARMLSQSGRCRVFDADADGYVRSEGCGIVVLKRLEDARSERHAILGNILGSAVNQDGATPGVTAPNQEAQTAVLRQAWRAAGVKPDDFGYLEAHGTGTPLGDPTELRAIHAALEGRGEDRPPCLVGSLKANIGHTEAAAGVVSLIKALLAVERGQVPPQVGVRRLNPRAGEVGDRLKVEGEAADWPVRSRRVAGVSAFGFGGTNCHVVVSEDWELPMPASSVGLPSLLTLSAASPDSLRRLAREFADFLRGESRIPFADLAWTTNLSRAGEAERLALLASDGPQAARLLEAFVSTGASRDLPLWTGHAGGKRTRVDLVCGDPRGMSHRAATGLPEALLERFAERDWSEDDRDAAVQCAAADQLRRALGDFAEVREEPGGERAAAVARGSLSLDQALDGVTPGPRAQSPSLPPPDPDATDGLTLRLGGADVEEDGVERLVAADRIRLLSALARLWTTGAVVRFDLVECLRASRVRGLPGHPFQRRRCWIEQAPPTAIEIDSRQEETPLPITESAPEEAPQASWPLKLAALDYLRDHRIGGSVVAPGSVLMDQVLEAAQRCLGVSGWSLRQVLFHRPLALGEESTDEVWVQFSRDGANRFGFQVLSQPQASEADARIRHASGALVGPSGAAGDGERVP